MGQSVEIFVPEFVQSLAESEELVSEGSTYEQHAKVSAKTFEK